MFGPDFMFQLSSIRITPIFYGLCLLVCMAPLNAQTETDSSEEGWGDDWGAPVKAKPWSVDWHGFAEGAFSVRTRDNPVISGDDVLDEGRLQLEGNYHQSWLTLQGKLDLLGDAVLSDADIIWREAWMSFPLGQAIDVRAGRQILTWGMGDLVFLNDLFPKDYISFFSGRDDEYLKAPSDAIKFSGYSSNINADFIWHPVFNSDLTLRGDRLSYFSPLLGAEAAAPPAFRPDDPDKEFDNGEFALRLYNTLRGVEWALYGYRGFFKQAIGMELTTMEPVYNRMNSFGASLRGSWRGAILFTEYSYYDSVDDEQGNDPLVPNSQSRYLAGMERELLPKLTLGLQYYMEWTHDHDAMEASAPSTEFLPDAHRHVLTMRLTRSLRRDNLMLSIFGFYSPSDEDYYLRPSLYYRFSDHLNMTVGANVFDGQEIHTFFGQMQHNSNIYGRIRYSF